MRCEVSGEGRDELPKSDKTKLCYLGHIMRREGSLENTVMLGKIEIRRKEKDEV